METSTSTSESQQTAGSAGGEGPPRPRYQQQQQQQPFLRGRGGPHKIGGDGHVQLAHKGYFNSKWSGG